MAMAVIIMYLVPYLLMGQELPLINKMMQDVW
jgi:hypothetical protein